MDYRFNFGQGETGITRETSEEYDDIEDEEDARDPTFEEFMKSSSTNTKNFILSGNKYKNLKTKHEDRYMIFLCLSFYGDNNKIPKTEDKLKWCLENFYLDNLLKQSGLMGAVKYNNINMVKILIYDKDIDINYKYDQYDDCSILTIACMGDNIDMIKLLLEHPNIQVDTLDKNGHTTFIDVLSRTGPLVMEIANLLLDKGADINKICNKNTSLLLSVCFYFNVNWKLQPKEINLEERLDLIKFLISKGANVNQVLSGGKTLLMLISGVSNSASDIEVVKLLLDNGANVNAQDDLGNTVLFYACESLEGNLSNVETIQLLLDRGADKTIKNKEGKTIDDICDEKIVLN